MTLSCIIIDDESLALDLLEDNIKRIPFLELKAKCRNAFEAIKIIQQSEIDLIISDIQMPALNGLQLIESLQHKPMVIFITAYENYAVQSFALNIIDYIIKPVSFERFLLAVNKALSLHRLKHIASQNENKNLEIVYIYINEDYGFVKIYFSDILFVEGLKNYVKINFKDNRKPIVTRMTMKAIEETLPADKFYRIHKSYIVADDAITIIKRNSVLLGSTELPIGDSYKEKVEAIINRKS